MYFLVLGIVAADLLLRLVLRPRREAEAPYRTSYVRILVNVAALVALAAAVLTSRSTPLTGDGLVNHVATAPAFALAAAAVTLFWAHRNRFAPADGTRLRSPATWAIPLRKFFFWVAVALAVPTMVSILAAMFPLFGTNDQQELLRVHSACGPWLAGAGLLFAYFGVVTWRVRSRD